MSEHTCKHCKRCAAERLGLDLSAPLTPAQYRELELALGQAPTGAPPMDFLNVDDDPKVVEAQSAVDKRTAEFEPADRAWKNAAATVREAELLAGSQLEHVAAKARRALPRLRDAEREALEERDRVWSKTVAARAELAVASRVAVQARLASDVPAKAAGPDAVKDWPAAEKVRRAPGVAFVPMPVVKDGRTGS